MSSVSYPVTPRPVGRAMVVANQASRAQPLAVLHRLGFQCAEADDPYSAMLELCRRPLVYRALILSVNSLFREELNLIATVKRRLPHVEVWLTHTDGRQASLAEAMRLGADGLLSDDGLHRTAPGAPVLMPPPAMPAPPEPEQAPAAPARDDPAEPILSAEELRALLQEQPTNPPGEQ